MYIQEIDAFNIPFNSVNFHIWSNTNSTPKRSAVVGMEFWKWSTIMAGNGLELALPNDCIESGIFISSIVVNCGRNFLMKLVFPRFLASWASRALQKKRTPCNQSGTWKNVCMLQLQSVPSNPHFQNFIPSTASADRSDLQFVLLNEWKSTESNGIVNATLSCVYLYVPVCADSIFILCIIWKKSA